MITPPSPSALEVVVTHAVRLDLHRQALRRGVQRRPRARPRPHPALRPRGAGRSDARSPDAPGRRTPGTDAADREPPCPRPSPLGRHVVADGNAVSAVQRLGRAFGVDLAVGRTQPMTSSERAWRRRPRCRPVTRRRAALFCGRPWPGGVTPSGAGRGGGSRSTEGDASRSTGPATSILDVASSTACSATCASSRASAGAEAEVDAVAEAEVAGG